MAFSDLWDASIFIRTKRTPWFGEERFLHFPFRFDDLIIPLINVYFNLADHLELRTCCLEEPH